MTRKALVLLALCSALSLAAGAHTARGRFVRQNDEPSFLQTALKASKSALESEVEAEEGLSALKDIVAKGTERVKRMMDAGWKLVECGDAEVLGNRKCIRGKAWIHELKSGEASHSPANGVFRWRNMVNYSTEVYAPGFAATFIAADVEQMTDDHAFHVSRRTRLAQAGEFLGHNLKERETCDTRVPAATTSTFIDFNITLKADRIISWNIYTCRPGKFRFQVFRAMKTRFDNQNSDFDAVFIMVGENEMKVDKPGKHLLTVPFDDRIMAEAGDFIGWTFDPTDDECGAIAVSDKPADVDLPYSNVGVFDSIAAFPGSLLYYKVATIRKAIYSIDVDMERDESLTPINHVSHDEVFVVDLGKKAQEARYGVYEKNGPHDPFSSEPEYQPEGQAEPNPVEMDSAISS